MLDPDRFARDLLAWYDTHKRDLPWRHRPGDAYSVWISEIMLQQTTVAAVIGYYERWFTRFPDIQTLAEASTDDVLHAWAGLGYYSRARNIHKTAQIVVRDFGGNLPNNVGELIKLPGIGRYTAGAIAAIAFGKQEASVDANVRRVLARVGGIKSEADDKGQSFDSLVWDLAERLVPEKRPGDYTQALMDLGSSVCTPKSPNCQVCPLNKSCVGNKSGKPESFPGKSKQTKWNVLRHISVALCFDGQVLIAQRSMQSNLWAGLWELPRIDVITNVSGDCTARKLAETLIDSKIEQIEFFGSIKHGVTNNKITLLGYKLELDSQMTLNQAILHQFGYSQALWVTEANLPSFALSSPQKRLITKLFVPTLF